MQVTYYELTSDVTNPEVDRRHKRHFDKCEAWPKGMRFAHHAVKDWPPTLEHASQYGRIGIANEAFELLLANARQVEPTITEMLKEGQVDGAEVLEHLDIDRAVIAEAIEAIHANLKD